MKKKCPANFLKRKITRKKSRAIFLSPSGSQNDRGGCGVSFVGKRSDDAGSACGEAFWLMKKHRKR